MLKSPPLEPSWTLSRAKKRTGVKEPACTMGYMSAMGQFRIAFAHALCAVLYALSDGNKPPVLEGEVFVEEMICFEAWCGAYTL